MKKNVSKKLKLNKETMANLEMEGTRAGAADIAERPRTLEYRTCGCPTSQWIICEYTCGACSDDCPTGSQYPQACCW